MTTTSVLPPANFNLAVETLKRTLRQDKVAVAVLSRAKEPQEQVKLNLDATIQGSDLSLGKFINKEV